MKIRFNISWTVLFLYLMGSMAHAEYRVYELKISKPPTKYVRMVTTTFDHIQYPTYYSLNAGEIIEYVDSWMCWENTANFAKLCPNPKTVPTVALTEQKP